MVSGIPEEFARRIRARGAVLDMALSQELYQPLLARQRRDGVEVQRDVPYGDDKLQRLDLYAPDALHAARPVLACFHGGGFVRGNRQQLENAGLYFARAGFITAVAGYRLAPRHRWPAGAQDVAAVIAWLRTHIARHGGDPQRIFLMGESAGAAHVATATLLKRFHGPDGPGIAGAVLCSGVYNVELELRAHVQFGNARPDARNRAYYGSDFARYPSMSTVEWIDAAPFPLLITYAELDLLHMQVQAGELFARLVTQHRFDPQLRVIAGHNHLTQVNSINTGDESLSAPVLAFLRSVAERAR